MSNEEKTENTMCGMDKEIFLATRTLTSLIGQACRWWSFLSDELASLDKAAQDALKKYQRDYPKQVADLIEKQNKDYTKKEGVAE